MIELSQSTDPKQFPPGYLDEYIGHHVIIYSVVFLTLQSFFMGLRFISRSIGNVSWGWDDSFLVAGAIACTGLITVSLCNVIYAGGGYHIARVLQDHPDQLILAMKYPIIISPIYYTAALLPKLSVLILYLRTFATIPHSFARRVCWFTFGVLVLNWLANVVVVFFMCTPFEYIWNKELEGGGTCINQFVWRPLSSVVNIITDVIMLLLPMKTIMGMHMSKKLGVAATFAIGNIGLVTSIIRFVGFFRYDFAKDSTWTMVQLMIVTMAEPELYLIAACLLSFRPLLRWIGDRLLFASLKKESAPNNTQRSSIKGAASYRSFEQLREEKGKTPTTHHIVGCDDDDGLLNDLRRDNREMV